MSSKSEGAVLVPVLLAFLLLSLSSVARTEELGFVDAVCSNATTFPPNSTFQRNLNQLFSILLSNATRPNGFYSAATGSDDPGSQVFGLFLCRGDLNTSTCLECVTAATQKLRQVCPVEKTSLVWYEQCTLRYSNQSNFPGQDVRVYYDTRNVSEPTRFLQLFGNTTKSLFQEVSMGGSYKKFGTRVVEFSSLQNLYLLAQCVPDLTVSDCGFCLQNAANALPAGKQGGSAFFPSCYVRFNLYNFFYSPAPPPPPPPALQLPPPSTPEVHGKGIRNDSPAEEV